MQDVIQRLAELFLALGSVNAIAEALSERSAEGEQRIYPNRIHGLLTGDPTRSINTATLDALESAIGAIGEVAEIGGETTTPLRQAVAAEATAATNPEEAIRRV